MKWTAEVALPKSRSFIIECFTSRDLITGAAVNGYYLYVYENGKNIYDYLQDTFEIAVDQAADQFGVPKDAWKQVDSGRRRLNPTG